jgi:phenylpyruvate tautomerase PptA (4-oxalocrotonate tautomerase family)
MPLYICSTPAAALDDTKRRRIAQAITHVHCDLTGAPPAFVHVVFDETPAEHYAVFGTIRAGRSEETKAELRRRVGCAVADSVDVDASRVGVVTSDVPAAWVMEGGAVMPEPGEEDDWLAAQHEAPERTH